MDCSMPGFPALDYLPEFTQIHVHWVGDAIQPPHPLLPCSPFAFNLSQHQSLPMSRLFALGSQSIGTSVSASVLPMNIQGWFPLGKVYHQVILYHFIFSMRLIQQYTSISLLLVFVLLFSYILFLHMFYVICIYILCPQYVLIMSALNNIKFNNIFGLQGD